MFGYVSANIKELTKPQQLRYGSVYCGICRQIRTRASQTARLGLRYDMAFLALLLMSLYEPEETAGNRSCMLHPIAKRPWVDNLYIQYAADMNVALAYYKAVDDVHDEGRLSAKIMAGVFGKTLPQIESRFPRQCSAIRNCIRELDALEKAGCANPDLTAGCFGRLMGELLVYREDMWSATLRQMGDALGRFIYLTDAAVDFRKDRRHGSYNPFLAMGMEEDWKAWENYLVLAMARCTRHFEALPLVQDKDILDAILYSGIWMEFRRNMPRQQAGQEETP